MRTCSRRHGGASTLCGFRANADAGSKCRLRGVPRPPMSRVCAQPDVCAAVWEMTEDTGAGIVCSAAELALPVTSE